MLIWDRSSYFVGFVNKYLHRSACDPMFTSSASWNGRFKRNQNCSWIDLILLGQLRFYPSHKSRGTLYPSPNFGIYLSECQIKNLKAISIHPRDQWHCTTCFLFIRTSHIQHCAFLRKNYLSIAISSHT